MTHEALRRFRHSTDAYSYLVTTVTDLRRPLFSAPDVAKICSDSLAYFHKARFVHSFAWVVMPDHIHWVLQLKKTTLPYLMRRFKNWTGREINRQLQTKGRSVWARAYHDRCLVTSRQVTLAIRYVINNPVVAGLVDEAEKYPHLHIGERYPDWDGTFVRESPGRESQIRSYNK